MRLWLEGCDLSWVWLSDQYGQHAWRKEQLLICHRWIPSRYDLSLTKVRQSPSSSCLYSIKFHWVRMCQLLLTNCLTCITMPTNVTFCSFTLCVTRSYWKRWVLLTYEHTYPISSYFLLNLIYDSRAAVDKRWSGIFQVRSSRNPQRAGTYSLLLQSVRIRWLSYWICLVELKSWVSRLSGFLGSHMMYAGMALTGACSWF